MRNGQVLTHGEVLVSAVAAFAYVGVCAWWDVLTKHGWKRAYVQFGALGAALGVIVAMTPLWNGDTFLKSPASPVEAFVALIVAGLGGYLIYRVRTVPHRRR